MAVSTWEDKAQVVRDERDASLSKVEPPLEFPHEALPLNSQDLPKQLLTAREIEITQDYSVDKLLELMRTKVLKVEEVTRAFLRRAAVAHYATNCLTELMWDEAIARAKHLDSLNEPAGPLHGLPISLKECHGMHVYDKPTNTAYVAWIGTPSLYSPINQTIFDAGCVFYARTNEPQSLAMIETNNNIYGRTYNPWNRTLSSGGSSGGEGALIGMRGSLLGLGGDIGGSVRVPAACCGIYGFKATASRLGVAGMKAAGAGNENVMPTYGPLSTDREAINLLMKVYLDAKPWRIDPYLTVKPWTPVTFHKPLKVAIQWDDGIIKPHPPIIRALHQVADACRAAGLKVVDWESHRHGTALDLLPALYCPDGGDTLLNPVREAGEPVLPLVKTFTSQPRTKKYTVAENCGLVVEREIYRAAYAAHWNSTTTDDGQEVDIIIGPVTPGASALHDTSDYWLYTSVWNLLDYPAAVFPVTFVDPAIDTKDISYKPMNDLDRRNHDLYDAQKWADAPVSLQIIGRRQMDEKVLAALEVVENAMGRT